MLEMETIIEVFPPVAENYFNGSVGSLSELKHLLLWTEMLYRKIHEFIDDDSWLRRNQITNCPKRKKNMAPQERCVVRVILRSH